MNQVSSRVSVSGAEAVLRNGPRRDATEQIIVAPLRQAVLTVPVIGETPLKCLRFSRKKQQQIQDAQAAGEQARTKRKRAPKDFAAEYEDAKYRCTVIERGKKVTWLGLNASGVRNGAIETCRMAGFVMTKAKMSIFCVQDGFDDLDKTPLVRVFGKEEMCIDAVRNASGVVDQRPRVMWQEWKMSLRLRFDEDQFSPADIINLMIRVGQQNGLGEGRPNGTNGNGTGNGLFLVDVDGCSLVRLPQAPATFKEEQESR